MRTHHLGLLETHNFESKLKTFYLFYKKNKNKKKHCIIVILEAEKDLPNKLSLTIFEKKTKYIKI